MNEEKVPDKLKPLAGEAAKYETFDDFESAFLREIKHGRYYHVTDNPNFTIDPEKGPRDMSSMAMGGVEKGKMMITSDLPYWTDFYKEGRDYVAIVDMSQVPKERYWQVNRGFGNELYVDDPSKAKVIKVITVAEAGRDAELHQNALEESITGSDALRKFYNKVKGGSEMAKPRTEEERIAIHERIFGKGSKPPLERLGLGQNKNDMMPMPPESGPPLPKTFGIRWPWKK